MKVIVLAIHGYMTPITLLEFVLVFLLLLKTEACFSLHDNLSITFRRLWCLIHLGLSLIWFWTSYDSDVGLMQMMLQPWRFYDCNISGMDHGCIWISKCVTFQQLIVSCVGLSFGWICVCTLCLGVGAWMIRIFYLDVFGLVNLSDAWGVWCIAFSWTWLRIENIVDGLNMAMALIIYISHHVLNISNNNIT